MAWKPMDAAKDDEKDEIVMEIPICHSKRLQNALYSFRYPLLRPNAGKLHIRGGKWKPQQQQVQLDLEIDLKSPNFDSLKAEQIAAEANGEAGNRKKTPFEDVFFDNDICDKVQLSSYSVMSESSDQYGALIYNGSEIHLTTLKDIFHFRPEFPYLDRAGRGPKRNSSSRKLRSDSDDNTDSEEENEPGPSGAQPVNVHFKHTHDRTASLHATKSTSKTPLIQPSAKQQEYEPWTDCRYFDEDTSFSRVTKLKLIAECTQDSGQTFPLSKMEYLRVLIPKDQEMQTDEPLLPSNVMSLHALRALPLFEQCRLLLKDAQIMQFQQLVMVFAGNEGMTPESFLKILPKVACLVRGNWVVKSEVLYPKNTLSAISGVPAELMCRARDYLLYLFTKHRYVERKKVSSIMKMPAEEVKEIFIGCSRLSRSHGWELIYDCDLEFIAKYQDVVQRQQELMEQRFTQICQFLRDNPRPTRRKSRSQCEDIQSVPKNKVESSDDSGPDKKSPTVVRKKRKIL